jgi:hypothetical protein
VQQVQGECLAGCCHWPSRTQLSSSRNPPTGPVSGTLSSSDQQQWLCIRQ